MFVDWIRVVHNVHGFYSVFLSRTYLKSLNVCLLVYPTMKSMTFFASDNSPLLYNFSASVRGREIVPE